MRGRVVIVIAALGAVLLTSRDASAQTGPAAPRAPGRPIEIAVGGSWSAPIGLGTVDAEFLTGTGSPIAQFETSNRLGQALGLVINLGFGLSRRLTAEAIGNLTWVPFETEITDDFEDADGVTLSETSVRFGVGGALRWLIAGQGATRWFLRGGGGWFREAAGGSSLVADGISMDGGIALVHLWRDRPRGGLRRLGLRVDGTVAFRTGGLTLGEDKLRVGPVVAGALTMGFR